MKKKITPEDLNLNIEVTGGERVTPKFTETLTCPQTRINCTDATFDKPQLCDTTTTNPSEQNCLSAGENDCKPTDKCPLTIEPACETKVGCEDSHSHAQLCCPITEQTDCRDSVDNCVSVDTCGQNTFNICLETSNDCAKTVTDCFVSLNGDETCVCAYTVEETCMPTIQKTE